MACDSGKDGPDCDVEEEEEEEGGVKIARREKGKKKNKKKQDGQCNYRTPDSATDLRLNKSLRIGSIHFGVLYNGIYPARLAYLSKYEVRCE